jgi:hypothetical protein
MSRSSPFEGTSTEEHYKFAFRRDLCVFLSLIKLLCIARTIALQTMRQLFSYVKEIQHDQIPFTVTTGIMVCLDLQHDILIIELNIMLTECERTHYSSSAQISNRLSLHIRSTTSPFVALGDLFEFPVKRCEM